MGPNTYVFSFEEGDGKKKRLLGGKGANLCEMTQIGLPVPPGFVITTEACLAYLDQKEKGLQPGLMEQVREAMTELENKTGKGFGNPDQPLLVSVRSGAAMSMPGMMDTILNLGLNEETVGGLIRLTNNERFVYDAYRRLIQLFGSVGLGMIDEDFDHIFAEIKAMHNAEVDTDLGSEALKKACTKFLALVAKKKNRPFHPCPCSSLPGPHR